MHLRVSIESTEKLAPVSGHLCSRSAISAIRLNIGYSRTWLSEALVASGQTAVLPPPWTTNTSLIPLADPMQSKHSAKVRAFGDYLVDAFKINATRACSAGTTSCTNHGFALSQMLFRGLGCGSGSTEDVEFDK
jgi:hypothetical protein